MDGWMDGCAHVYVLMRVSVSLTYYAYVYAWMVLCYRSIYLSFFLY